MGIVSYRNCTCSRKKLSLDWGRGPRDRPSG